MASLFRRADSIHIRFRFQGFEFKRTLKTQNQSDADCARAIVEQTIYRMTKSSKPGLLGNIYRSRLNEYSSRTRSVTRTFIKRAWQTQTSSPVQR